MRWLIKPNQVFLDGYDRFEPKFYYDVLEEKGKYFKQYGWADRVMSKPRFKKVKRVG